MGRRLLKVNEAVREVLSSVIAEGLKDPRIGFVTVTSVETSADLRHAKVFVSVLGGEREREETLAGSALVARLPAGARGRGGAPEAHAAARVRLRRIGRPRHAHQRAPAALRGRGARGGRRRTVRRGRRARATAPRRPGDEACRGRSRRRLPRHEKRDARRGGRPREPRLRRRGRRGRAPRPVRAARRRGPPVRRRRRAAARRRAHRAARRGRPRPSPAGGLALCPRLRLLRPHRAAARRLAGAPRRHRPSSRQHRFRRAEPAAAPGGQHLRDRLRDRRPPRD